MGELVGFGEWWLKGEEVSDDINRIKFWLFETKKFIEKRRGVDDWSQSCVRAVVGNSVSSVPASLTRGRTYRSLCLNFDWVNQFSAKISTAAQLPCTDLILWHWFLASFIGKYAIFCLAFLVWNWKKLLKSIWSSTIKSLFKRGTYNFWDMSARGDISHFSRRHESMQSHENSHWFNTLCVCWWKSLSGAIHMKIIAKFENLGCDKYVWNFCSSSRPP